MIHKGELLVFITSFISPHTLPLGVELTKFYNKVVFINMLKLTDERKRMGYDMKDSRVEVYNIDENYPLCKTMINHADILIMAGTMFDLVKQRIKDNKPIYIMHERIFKKGFIKWFDIRTYKIAMFCHQMRDKNVYLLAIGRNAAKDFYRLGFEKGKIYNFGYFPELESYSENLTQKQSEKIRVLWVGRMVDFKRPIMALKVFRRMPQEFVLEMIGDGKLFEKAKKYSNKHNIPVEFKGNLSNDLVKKQMIQADVFLSTSNKGEGWGAVINEAMNCKCAVVCSKDIGCAGVLASNENAVLFNTNSICDCRKALKIAAKQKEDLAEKSYSYIQNEFNPSIAAERLYTLVIMADKDNGFKRGICSRVFETE